MKSITLEQLINLLREKQGNRTQVELANELGITPQFLSDIYAGYRTPGEKVLEALGLEKQVSFVPVKIAKS